MSKPQQYTIKQVADLAGVSVRTLHHYDEIGLLKPATLGANGYRYYGSEQLLRLQQILFFKQLEFSLQDIQRMVESPNYDPVIALQDQKDLLELERKRLDTLIQTINTTITHMEDNTDFEDAHKFAGLDDETIAEYKAEVYKKYDPKLVQESVQRVKSWGKEGLKKVQEEGMQITVALAERMDKGFDDPEVQALVAQHHQHINRFYDCTLEIYRGLGDMYVADPRFTAYYEKVKPGNNFAEFMRDAMHYYADNSK